MRRDVGTSRARWREWGRRPNFVVLRQWIADYFHEKHSTRSRRVKR